MSNINLLPWRIDDKKKKKNVFLFVLGLSLFAVIGLSFAGKLLIDMKISAQNDRNQFLTMQTLIVEKRIADIREIKKQKKSLERRIKAIKTLEKERNSATLLFNTLVDVTPRGVYLSEITFSGSDISARGLSESNKRLARMVRSIDGSGWLNDANISSVVAGPSKPIKVSKFSMNFVVSNQQAEKK